MTIDPVETAMLNLMDALSEDIIHAEALANALVEGADALSDQPRSTSILDAAIGWRVRAIELRGQLGALHEDYRSRFHRSPPR